MTSRRDFFGLMAVAPFAAPAAVQSVKDASSASGSHFNFGSIGIVGERTSEQFMTPNQVRAAMFRPIQMHPSDLNLLEARQFQIEEICAAFGCDPLQISQAPNRLHGAYINKDGDAV